MSHTFSPEVIAQIQERARLGGGAVRGLGARRATPGFDDLLLLPAGLSGAPDLPRERCDTRTILGTRHAEEPVVLDIPITIAGMSFGALSSAAKEALGRAATMTGTSTTTGEGGMAPVERDSAKTLVYQCLPSRFGFDPDHLRAADAVEIVLGQGAVPGGGGMLLGQKVTTPVAFMRDLPEGVDQRTASRHPDWAGPEGLRVKIEELREVTAWRIPVYVKIGASRVAPDVRHAVEAGADVIVVDGMQGGTGAAADVFIEHTGIPTLAATRVAADTLRTLGMDGQVQLVVSGGIRSGADVAKALALGADAVSVGVAALIALGCNSPSDDTGADVSLGYRALGTVPGSCTACHTGGCPVGIATQDDMLADRLDPDFGAERVANFLRALTKEATMLARACGKSSVHQLGTDDLVALTVEAAAMARVPLAGTSWIPGTPIT
ncbi:FMN-binding glutamate synthase family protein [Sphaerisporangium melleum]|uniref:FMN-binding glutamate synthase family protein n=1 Tax=Sphaerisporangium melleum TaxID=321316 RepID=A0A917RIT3_9ACTN|nr:FMN-binding glutamate synthase family protein [Sphaerisporangium melleum]GGL09618.1 FMN-binding glutamate synthase family protein [Sphaerisporangium melleum]GII67588.1 FMN-binding glutamate synthase family protein [Sphaerisporangium melleum]